MRKDRRFNARRAKKSKLFRSMPRLIAGLCAGVDAGWYRRYLLAIVIYRARQRFSRACARVKISGGISAPPDQSNLKWAPPYGPPEYKGTGHGRLRMMHASPSPLVLGGGRRCISDNLCRARYKRSADGIACVLAPGNQQLSGSLFSMPTDGSSSRVQRENAWGRLPDRTISII